MASSRRPLAQIRLATIEQMLLHILPNFVQDHLQDSPRERVLATSLINELKEHLRDSEFLNSFQSQLEVVIPPEPASSWFTLSKHHHTLPKFLELKEILNTAATLFSLLLDTEKKESKAIEAISQAQLSLTDQVLSRPQLKSKELNEEVEQIEALRKYVGTELSAREKIDQREELIATIEKKRKAIDLLLTTPIDLTLEKTQISNFQELFEVINSKQYDAGFEDIDEEITLYSIQEKEKQLHAKSCQYETWINFLNSPELPENLQKLSLGIQEINSIFLHIGWDDKTLELLHEKKLEKLTKYTEVLCEYSLKEIYQRIINHLTILEDNSSIDLVKKILENLRDDITKEKNLLPSVDYAKTCLSQEIGRIHNANLAFNTAKKNHTALIAQTESPLSILLDQKQCISFLKDIFPTPDEFNDEIVLLSAKKKELKSRITMIQAFNTEIKSRLDKNYKHLSAADRKEIKEQYEEISKKLSTQIEKLEGKTLKELKSLCTEIPMINRKVDQFATQCQAFRDIENHVWERVRNVPLYQFYLISPKDQMTFLKVETAHYAKYLRQFPKDSEAQRVLTATQDLTNILTETGYVRDLSPEMFSFKPSRVTSLFKKIANLLTFGFLENIIYKREKMAENFVKDFTLVRPALEAEESWRTKQHIISSPDFLAEEKSIAVNKINLEMSALDKELEELDVDEFDLAKSEDHLMSAQASLAAEKQELEKETRLVKKELDSANKLKETEYALRVQMMDQAPHLRTDKVSQSTTATANHGLGALDATNLTDEAATLEPTLVKTEDTQTTAKWGRFFTIGENIKHATVIAAENIASAGKEVLKKKS